ncbi:hypothetical protein FA13DRAFT_1717433 [Coprinellus micaceus]|uniref:Uncharacterized protein n=1 Tax=Coprinellus micaceus TaxID=71717 RepID=A0A4Y7SG23_COPMI|nr:hypothetical protein FA13DRAFT_1717433 [Coprinellus micaceus]
MDLGKHKRRDAGEKVEVWVPNVERGEGVWGLQVQVLVIWQACGDGSRAATSSSGAGTGDDDAILATIDKYVRKKDNCRDTSMFRDQYHSLPSTLSRGAQPAHQPHQQPRPKRIPENPYRVHHATQRLPSREPGTDSFQTTLDLLRYRTTIFHSPGYNSSMPASTPAKRARQRANKVARTAETTSSQPHIILPPLPVHSQPTPPNPPKDENHPDEPVSLDQLLAGLAERFEHRHPAAGPIIAEAFRSGVHGGCTLASKHFQARYQDFDEHVQSFILDYESRLEELQAAAYERGVADERVRREAEANVNVQHPEPSPPSTTTSKEPDEPVPEHCDLNLLSPNQRIVFERGYERGYAEGIHIMLERMSEKNAKAVEGAFEEGRKDGWAQAQENAMEQRQQDTDYAFEKGLEAGRLEACSHPQENDNLPSPAPSTISHPSSPSSIPSPTLTPTEASPSPPKPSPSPPEPELDSQIRIPGRGPAFTVGPPEADTPDDAVPTSFDHHAPMFRDQYHSLPSTLSRGAQPAHQPHQQPRPSRSSVDYSTVQQMTMVATRAVERLNCMVQCIRVVVRKRRGTLGGREDLGRLWDVGMALRSHPPILPGVRERTAEWSKPVKGASEFGCRLVGVAALTNCARSCTVPVWGVTQVKEAKVPQMTQRRLSQGVVLDGYSIYSID